MKRRDEPIPALSTGLSHVMLAGLLLFAALPLPRAARLLPGAPSTVGAPEGAVPAPATTPEAAAQPQAQAQTADVWPEAEIVAAKEQCTHLLSSVAADVEMLAPVRKGPCGLPAPVLLKAIGSEPKIVFDPPVEVNCRMVAALGDWVKSTLQPKAQEQFRSEVVRIVGASGYSCRNIYNLPNARLSQHALANAIDIGGFTLGSGRTIWVAKGWGATARDIRAAKAKAEAEAKAKKAGTSSEKAEAEADAGEDGDKDKDKDKAPAGQSKLVARASLMPLASSSGSQKKPGLLDVKATAALLPSSKPTKEGQFLRAIHGGACGPFGTVLGPEANEPHRSHFHLDLIPRKSRSFCE